MKLGNLPLVSLALFLAWGCSKETATDGSQNPPNASKLAELTIPTTFNWSSSVKGNLNLKINAPSYFTTEGQWLELRDGKNQVLDRQVIKNGSVQFYLNFPQLDHNLYAHYPYTGEKYAHIIRW
ncbi:MAG: hypothetical protein U5L96_09975 [Owenweeksia sp.]|nr:hypothetical protein [Owenweeksia sp.]